MTIIRDRSKLAEASNADLLETYNAMTGKSIAKFASRAAGETQTSNAIMLGEDRAGKLGVKKGKKPVAMTVAEEQEALKARGLSSELLARIEATASAAGKPAPATAAPAAKPAKGLRAKLAEKAQGEPFTPKAKPEKKGDGSRAPKVTHVLPKEGGLLKMREDSDRAKVLKLIQTSFARSKKAVPVERITEQFERNCRGFVQKLIQFGHLAPAAEGQTELPAEEAAK
jgi:hypothetical protein